MSDGFEDLTGKEVRGFRFGRVLGDGPRARVFEGEQVTLRRKVALKVLRPELAAVPAERDAFLEAARAAAGLIHPNVIPIVNVMDTDPLAMVVEELSGCPTLGSVVSSGRPLPFQEICQVALHALEVLRALHAGGRYHGDLCPENVFAADDGRYRISDFHHNPLTALTPGSSWMGRSGYVAPELRLGGRGDPRSDLYALGMLLHFAASGEPPGTVDRLPEMPPSFLELLQWFCRSAPDRRPASTEAATQAVERMRQEARAGGGVWALSARADLPPPNRRRYHRLTADATINMRPAYRPDLVDTPVLESRLRDIGENGIFVATDQPLPIGELLALDFDLERSGRVQALGVVRWLSRPPSENGMGVQFVEVAYPARESLARYIDGRMPAEAERALMATPAHRAVLRILPTRWSRPPATAEEWAFATDLVFPDFDQVLGDFLRMGLINETTDGRFEALYPASRVLLQTIVRLSAEAAKH